MIYLSNTNLLILNNDMKGYFIVEVHVLNNTKLYQNFALKMHFPQIVIEIIVPCLEKTHNSSIWVFR